MSRRQPSINRGQTKSRVMPEDAVSSGCMNIFTNHTPKSDRTRVDMTQLNQHLEQCMKRVTEMDQLREKNRSLIAELRQMNEKLQMHCRGSFRKSQSVSRREELRYVPAQRDEDPYNERFVLQELKQRMSEMKTSHRQEQRLALHQIKDLNERLNQMSHKKQQLRSDLDQKEEELKECLTQVNHLSEENHSLRSTLEQKEKDLNERQREIRQSRKRIHAMEKSHTEELRSMEQRKEEDMSKRMRAMDKAHEQKLRTALEQKDLDKRVKQLSHKNQQLRSDLDQKEEELKECLTQVNHLSEENHSLRSALEQTQGRKVPSSCQRCEQQNQEHKQEMTEMETFYKDKLTEARSALKKKEEELRSFKDRVAENMVLSLKTENTENMNNPVNQSRLTEMYHQLRVCTWPKINLKSSDKDTRKLVQETFGAAAEHVKALRTSIRTVSGAKEPTSPKVEKFRQSALENLQLSLLHSSKQDVFKAVFPQFDGGLAEMQLASECYWLGCLMALHTPPLHPHWDKDSADPESWTVFPWTIRSDRRSINRV